MGSHASFRAVLDAVRRIVQELRLSSVEAERKVGLSGAQLFVLRQLATGAPLSLTEVAARTLTHQSSVSVVAQKLVRLGLVARRASSRDARRAELTLTARGARTLRRAPPVAQDRLVEAVSLLRPQQRRALAALLSTLVDSMGARSKTPALFFEDPRA